MTPTPHPSDPGDEPPSRLEPEALAAIFAALREDGYTLVGPTVRDGAIVYDELTTPEDLPVGVTDEQEAGRYRLAPREDRAFFGFVVGPHSFKKFLFPPRLRLFSASRTTEGAVSITPDAPRHKRLALIGARGCEIAAISIQDKVFTGGAHTDPHYAAARADLFVLGVSCVAAAPTCFCVSMGTGPRARRADLTLTEVIDASDHYFVASAATERGRSVLARAPRRPATESDRATAHAHESRAETQKRRLEVAGLAAALAAAGEHPRWDDVAARCLSCASCTMVCPTCFCSTVEDTVDLTGQHAERSRRWDSCFTSEHTYLHGGPVRASTRSRYRQWLTHKLSTWHDQFGTSGCVGCGRCITFCPVGIDLTCEARALASKDP